MQRLAYNRGTLWGQGGRGVCGVQQPGVEQGRDDIKRQLILLHQDLGDLFRQERLLHHGGDLVVEYLDILGCKLRQEGLQGGCERGGALWVRARRSAHGDADWRVAGMKGEEFIPLRLLGEAGGDLGIAEVVAPPVHLAREVDGNAGRAGQPVMPPAITPAWRAQSILGGSQRRRVLCEVLDQLGKVAQVDVGRGQFVAEDGFVGLGVGARLRHGVLVHGVKRGDEGVQRGVEGSDAGQIDGGKGDVGGDGGGSLRAREVADKGRVFEAHVFINVRGDDVLAQLAAVHVRVGDELAQEGRIGPAQAGFELLGGDGVERMGGDGGEDLKLAHQAGVEPNHVEVVQASSGAPARGPHPAQ